MRRAASKKSSLRRACVANIEPFPGSERPSASVKQFIEFAVNIPEHEPQVGHAADSIAFTFSSLSESSAAITIASTRSRRRFSPSQTTFPDSIGPPETKIVGILRRIDAINMPGVILSQFEIQIIASAQ